MKNNIKKLDEQGIEILRKVEKRVDDWRYS